MGIKKFLKKQYFIVCRLLQSLVSSASVLLFSKRNLSKTIHELRGQVANEVVSILANGPSAKEIINSRPDLLRGTDVIVMNYFANTDSFWVIKPRYYIVLDPGFFVTDHVVVSEITKSNCNLDNQLLCENLKKADWEMTFFAPFNKVARQSISQYIVNPHIKLVWYNTTRVLGFDGFQNLFYRKSLGLPSSRNVAIAALMSMINMGYKGIHLYGMEFSWTKTMDIDPENGKMFFNDKHSYSSDEIRYFDKGGYKWWLETIVDDLNAMEQISKFADYTKTKITNRTKGSFIDSFEYENPDKIPAAKDI